MAIGRKIISYIVELNTEIFILSIATRYFLILGNDYVTGLTCSKANRYFRPANDSFRVTQLTKRTKNTVAAAENFKRYIFDRVNNIKNEQQCKELFTLRYSASVLADITADEPGYKRMQGSSKYSLISGIFLYARFIISNCSSK